jgi:2-hydroxy-6-oxonona-2,4-dienedioate hydrolase
MALLPMRLVPPCELHAFHDCSHWAMVKRRADFESVALAFLLRNS